MVKKVYNHVKSEKSIQKLKQWSVKGSVVSWKKAMLCC